MATKKYKIPLDENSTPKGERSFKELVDARADATFKLTNVSGGTTSDELNLITKKNGVTKDHKFSVAVSGGSASVTLTVGQLSAVYGDADGGDWDYVETHWTVSQVDTPNPSNLYIEQDGQVYNVYGW